MFLLCEDNKEDAMSYNDTIVDVFSHDLKFNVKVL